jgi:hypothetical protein
MRRSHSRGTGRFKDNACLKKEAPMNFIFVNDPATKNKSGQLCAEVTEAETGTYKSSTCEGEAEASKGQFIKINAGPSGGAPMILVLPEQGFTKLKYEGKTNAGSKVVLETAGDKTFACEGDLVLASYTALPEKPNDANTGTGDDHIEKCKKEKVACRSEEGATKDPVETVLALLALTVAAELTKEKVLQFLLIRSIKGTLFLNCGGVKEEIKGAVPCLVGGAANGTELAEGATVTITCTSEKSGKQVTGECTEPKSACEKLAAEPLLANIGAGFEKASESVSVSGSHNEMITLDF